MYNMRLDAGLVQNCHPLLALIFRPSVVRLTRLPSLPSLRADAPCGADLLQRSAGKDVTKAFEAAQHSPQALELLKGLLVGPLLDQEGDAPAAAGGAAALGADAGSLSSPLVDTERSLALLLGLQAAALYRATPPQPAELQAAPLLQTGVFDGGLEVSGGQGTEEVARMQREGKSAERSGPENGGEGRGACGERRWRWW